jgi:hypothetical protein
MAVKSATARKSNPRKPAKTRPKGANGSNGVAKEYEVITLRIDKSHKAKLLDHCAKRAKQEGRQMSFNRAIIEWIEGI